MAMATVALVVVVSYSNSWDRLCETQHTRFCRNAEVLGQDIYGRRYHEYVLPIRTAWLSGMLSMNP